MKKTLFIIAACALAAVSCQKEMAFDNEINSEGILTVTADIAQFEADTKTSIDGTAASIRPLWSADDSIKLFNKAGEAFVYVVKSTDVGKSSAEFEPKDPAKTFSGEFACAYYPAANATAYVDGTGITAYIPTEQAYVAASGENAGTFANGSFPMIGTGTLNAESKNLNLTFKNVFGLVQLNFTGTETIKQIELVSTQMISGWATITIDGKCTFVPIKNGKKTLNTGQYFVDLTTTTGTQPTLCSQATAFYIAVPADSTISKIYVTTTSTSTRPLFKVKDITVSRSRIASLKSSTLSGVGFAEVDPYPGVEDQMPVVAAGAVWAPVNCGYDASHTYGLIYQWGRKVGGGYDTTEGMQTATAATYTDGYNKNPDDNKFYYQSASPQDWYTDDINKQLSDWPMKSGDAGYVEGKIANPCPDGWRVPNYELRALIANYSDETTVTVGGVNQQGRWFSGGTAYSESGLRVFLPYAGTRSYKKGNAAQRGTLGYYWRSDGQQINFKKSAVATGAGGVNASGYSVRCVSETKKLF